MWWEMGERRFTQGVSTSASTVWRWARFVQLSVRLWTLCYSGRKYVDGHERRGIVLGFSLVSFHKFPTILPWPVFVAHLLHWSQAMCCAHWVLKRIWLTAVSGSLYRTMVENNLLKKYTRRHFTDLLCQVRDRQVYIRRRGLKIIISTFNHLHRWGTQWRGLWRRSTGWERCLPSGIWFRLTHHIFALTKFTPLLSCRHQDGIDLKTIQWTQHWFQEFSTLDHSFGTLASLILFCA